jgi:hypothetical protein
LYIVQFFIQMSILEIILQSFKWFMKYLFFYKFFIIISLIFFHDQHKHMEINSFYWGLGIGDWGFGGGGGGPPPPPPPPTLGVKKKKKKKKKN